MSRLLAHVGLAAATLAAITLAAAPGHGVAASSTSSVTMAVQTDLAIDSTQCPSSTGLLGASRGAAAAVVTGTPCIVSFGTANSPSGASLQVTDQNDAWAVATSPIPTYTIPDIPSNPGTFPASGFGACLSAASGGAAAVAPVSVSTCTSASTGWFGIDASVATPVAQTSGIGSGSASLKFGVKVPMNQAPMSYVGEVTFTVVPR